MCAHFEIGKGVVLENGYQLWTTNERCFRECDPIEKKYWKVHLQKWVSIIEHSLSISRRKDVKCKRKSYLVSIEGQSV
jgi:hypothetical protein